MYECTYFLPIQETGKVTFAIHVEDNDRHIAFAAECECGLVHDLQMSADGLVECEFIIFHGLRILLRVSSIDAIHAGSLQQRIRSDFKRTQGSPRISREEGFPVPPAMRATPPSSITFTASSLI